MRRTARALSVAVLAGTALGGAAGGARADGTRVEGLHVEDVRMEGGRAEGIRTGAGAGARVGTEVVATARVERGRPPTAEVGPATVRPGGSVTVAVSCGPLEGPAPKAVEATSEAFAEGTVELHRVPGGDHTSGPAYRGTARIAPAAELGLGEAAGDRGGPEGPHAPGGADGAHLPDGPDGPGGAHGLDSPDDPGAQGGRDDRGDLPGAVLHGPAPDGTGHPTATGGPHDTAPHTAPGDGPADGPAVHAPVSAAPTTAAPVPGGSRWTVDGACPAPPGAAGARWSAAFTVIHGGGTPTALPDGHHPCREPRTGGEDGPCDGAVAQRGVHAGEGGAFTDSVPALAAGGLFIAAALGGAAYRLRPRRPTGEA